MNTFDIIRYGMAILVIASFPFSLLLWVVIHPFSGFWRSLGAVRTYLILGIPLAGYVAVVWIFRAALVGTDYGTSPAAITLAAVCLVAALLLNRIRSRQLNFSALSGVPELAADQFPGKLLTEGIYGVVRHPRYIEAYLWTTGYAFIANHLGSYLTPAVCLPVLYLVVVLEERELRGRFGEDYVEYCRRVPRFIPRWNLRKRSG
jgi:protein-S-isoprenylcysteine O-methyltransferase Ste14